MRHFEIIDVEQGSDEWKQARIGLVTGSRADCIVAKIKSGEAATRRDYRIELLAERLTGNPGPDIYFSKEMAWGVENEPFARMAYESMTGEMVRQTGFLRSTSFAAGASLDGDLQDMEGIIEIKCPKTATHLSYLELDGAPKHYMPQITHNLLISGAAWCDFVSFDPRLPDHLQFIARRVYAADIDMKGYEEELVRFLAELDVLENNLRGRK